MGSPIFKTILIKLSGEVLMGEDKFGFNSKAVSNIVDEIISIHNLNIRLAIVIGGGNIFRGVNLANQGLDRATGDYMGMLATVMNAIALKDILNTKRINTRVLSAINISQVAEPYIRGKAISHLDKNRIVIFAAGTGNPFTTDTAGALRAIEINSDIMIKATKVDGIYDKDPIIHSSAKRYTKISFDEAINKKLGVMDATAMTLCRDHKLDVGVVSILKKESCYLISMEMTWVVLLQISNMSQEIINNTKLKMNSSVDYFSNSLQKIRTGRANPSLLSGIMVDYYGTQTPISQVASVSVPDSNSLLITPWDKTFIVKLDKVIRESDLGLNPQTTDESIRIPLPPLTEERRKDLIKIVKKESENAKVSIRNIRRDANNDLKNLNKDNLISDDDLKKNENDIQKLTDDFIRKIDDIFTSKEKELLSF